MSGPISRNKDVDYRSRRNLYEEDASPQENERTRKAASSSLQSTERAQTPLQRSRITSTPNHEKIAPTYENRIGRRLPSNENTSLANRKSSHSHRIESTPTHRTKTSSHQKKTKKSKQTVRENPPPSSFQIAYLFFAGICALIGGILYGLFRYFSNQPTSPPLTIKIDQQEPLLPFMGKREQNLAYLASKHNPHFMKNLKSLQGEHSITGVRPIRGDGNCYYRATLFGLLEQVIQKNPKERQSRLEYIANVFKQIRPQTQAHKEFIERLEQAAGGFIWNSMEELEAAFLDQDFNSVMIRSAKDLLADWTRKNAATAFNGLTLENSITTTGYETVEAFISKAITPEGRCAEGPPIDLGGLGMALGFNSVIYLLPREEGSKISIHGNLSAKTTNEVVHLVLRPGHYDLVYKSTRADRELKVAMYKSASYIPDKNVYGSKPLDSIKQGLMGFENPNEPLLPLSEEVKAQIDMLKRSHNITRWRPIAGDGNCYYRANMFGLIERIITNGNRQRFNELAEIFERITPSLPPAYKASHEHFVEGLKAAAAGELWNTLDSFKHDVVHTTLDEEMVRAARYLVASEIEHMAGRPDEHGITIEDLIEGRSLQNYCNTIRGFGWYAEGPHVNMSILSQALRFPLTLHTAAGSQGLFTLEQTLGYENEKVSILLVSEREHYVLVYPKSRRS